MTICCSRPCYSKFMQIICHTDRLLQVYLLHINSTDSFPSLFARKKTGLASDSDRWRSPRWTLLDLFTRPKDSRPREIQSNCFYSPSPPLPPFVIALTRAFRLAESYPDNRLANARFFLGSHHHLLSRAVANLFLRSFLFAVIPPTGKSSRLWFAESPILTGNWIMFPILDGKPTSIYPRTIYFHFIDSMFSLFARSASVNIYLVNVV